MPDGANTLRPPSLSVSVPSAVLPAARHVSPLEDAQDVGPVLLSSPPVDLDLVIPAYNEEHRISPTIEAIVAEVSTSPYSVRLLVVDNGSIDATADVVGRLSARHHCVHLISCQQQGKGAAVRAGVAHADAPFVGYVDADQSTPPEAVLTGLAILRSGWDVVIGSRRAFGARYVVPQPLVRRLGSKAFNLAATTITGRVSDTQCGMKLFRTEAAKRLFALGSLNGFAFDVEVIARAKRAGLRAMELPVAWVDSEGSSFHPLRDGVRAFGELYAAHKVLRAASD
ncbi:dolichyl-phosphate beta-glucosyltransferase [Kineococcus sp. SYSU DK018]|uniref:dolichyl-phosphate beta-glucosyltransferase n=1 Tax=Kineococcus sp. SYSU DK018 TaxID=3383139 RepID=UPI003D7EF165